MDLFLIRAKELQTETLEVPEAKNETQLAQSEYYTKAASSSFIDNRSSVSQSVLENPSEARQLVHSRPLSRNAQVYRGVPTL